MTKIKQEHILKGSNGNKHYELTIGIKKYVIDNKIERDGKIHIYRYDESVKCLSDAYIYDEVLTWKDCPTFDTFEKAVEWIRKHKSKLL